MNAILLYLSSAIITAWGVAYPLVTRGVVAGFGEITTDNRRIVTMELITEGLALISISGIVTTAASFEPTTIVSTGIYAVAIGTLPVLAVVSLFTSFRIVFLLLQLCPLVFVISAILMKKLSQLVERIRGYGHS